MKRILTSTILAAAVLFSFCDNASAQTTYKDIFDLIRGKVPGVQVGQAGPGTMPTIIIRGIGTNTDQTQPLFFVDGVETDNISTINPNDVDSIDIIKDGTSAIYGMRGANGVILITTKGAALAAQQEAEQRRAERLAKKEARKKKTTD